MVIGVVTVVGMVGGKEEKGLVVVMEEDWVAVMVAGLVVEMGVVTVVGMVGGKEEKGSVVGMEEDWVAEMVEG